MCNLEIACYGDNYCFLCETQGDTPSLTAADILVHNGRKIRVDEKMKSVRTGRSPLVSLGLSINSEMTNLALESESGLGRGVAWIPIQRRSSHSGWGYFNSIPWGLRWDSFAFMWILRRVWRRCRFCRSCVSRVLFSTVDHFFLISLDFINQKCVLWSTIDKGIDLACFLACWISCALVSSWFFVRENRDVSLFRSKLPSTYFHSILAFHKT